MAIPDEDRGPVWLRDWQYIEADIGAMDDFAKKLRAEVETNYIAHLTPILDSATTELPPVNEGFAELVGLLTTHRTAHEDSTHFVRDYANRSAGLASAASEISTNYGESDAFARASVGAVDRALADTGVTALGAPGTSGAARPGGDPNAGATVPTSEEQS